MSEYRFFVNEHDGNGEPTIYRAKPIQLADDSGDSWRFYWDSDQMVAVYDHSSTRSYTSSTSGPWTERAERVIESCYQYEQDVDDALTRLAVRLFDHDAPNARFITVGIDRGVTLYCLSWDGDPEGKWADEIEALASGDVWRFEAQEYNVFTESWDESDEWDTYYGEANMTSEFLRQYPLAEFPAHLVVPEVGA